MDRMNELKSLVEKEIGIIVDQGCVKPDQWANLDKAVDIYKDIITTEQMIGYNRMDEYSQASFPRYHIPQMKSYAEDMNDSRGSRMGSQNSYENSYNQNSYVEDPMFAIKVLQNELDRTQDPNKRNKLIDTIEMLKVNR